MPTNNTWNLVLLGMLLIHLLSCQENKKAKVVQSETLVKKPIVKAAKTKYNEGKRAKKRFLRQSKVLKKDGSKDHLYSAKLIGEAMLVEMDSIASLLHHMGCTGIVNHSSTNKKKFPLYDLALTPTLIAPAKIVKFEDGTYLLFCNDDSAKHGFILIYDGVYKQLSMADISPLNLSSVGLTNMKGMCIINFVEDWQALSMNATRQNYLVLNRLDKTPIASLGIDTRYEFAWGDHVDKDLEGSVQFTKLSSVKAKVKAQLNDKLHNKKYTCNYDYEDGQFSLSNKKELPEAIGKSIYQNHIEFVSYNNSSWVNLNKGESFNKLGR